MMLLKQKVLDSGVFNKEKHFLYFFQVVHATMDHSGVYGYDMSFTAPV